jgi:hypothetical protein
MRERWYAGPVLHSLDVHEKPISIVSIESKITPEEPAPQQTWQTSVSVMGHWHWFKRYCLMCTDYTKPKLSSHTAFITIE